MIYKFSRYLTRLLCKESMISDDQEELYDYGFQITIANMTNFVIALLTGICFHAVIEMAFIYCIFVSLRFFCGGYHADTYGKCFLLFAVTCMTCLWVAKWIAGYQETWFLLFPASLFFLGLCIWKKAPVENPNRPMTDGEKKIFKKRSFQIYSFWTVSGIILWAFHQANLTASFISAFIAVAILMILKEGGNGNEGKNTETAG